MRLVCEDVGSEDNLIGPYCGFRSAFENRICPGWQTRARNNENYDLGHLAASSGTYDVEQVRTQCKRRAKDGSPVGPNTLRAHPDYASCKWHASYMMTNIVPQAAKFNRGCWRDIEKAVMTYSMQAGDDLDVVAGTDIRENKWALRP